MHICYRVTVVVTIIATALVISMQQAPVAAQTAPSRPSTTAQAAPVPRTPWGTPDLHGIWSTATTTPLERPAELAGKEFFTPQEAAEFSKRVVNQRDTDQRREGIADVTAAYNNHWYDYGTKFIPTLRTSLVIDPSDGRVPPLTTEGQKRAAAATPISGFQDGRLLESWLDMGLWERCITRGMPNVMLPTAYNNHLQIFQTPQYVVVLAEMIHEARIIPLDGRPRLAPVLQQWTGSSRGRWEGDTLVVETTNFTNKTTFRGSSDNLHLTERFTRVSADVLRYQVTVSDPSTFTKPWTIEVPATAAEGQIYEYACHEGNYAIPNALSGSRAAERTR
jgi:hypothetical protein